MVRAVRIRTHFFCLFYSEFVCTFYTFHHKISYLHNYLLVIVGKGTTLPKNLFSIQSRFLKIIFLFYFDCELEVQLGQLFSKEQTLCETLSREDAFPVPSSLQSSVIFPTYHHKQPFFSCNNLIQESSTISGSFALYWMSNQ